MMEIVIAPKSLLPRHYRTPKSSLRPLSDCVQYHRRVLVAVDCARLEL